MKWKSVKGYKTLTNKIIKANFGLSEDAKFKVIKIKRVPGNWKNFLNFLQDWNDDKGRILMLWKWPQISRNVINIYTKEWLPNGTKAIYFHHEKRWFGK